MMNEEKNGMGTGDNSHNIRVLYMVMMNSIWGEPFVDSTCQKFPIIYALSVHTGQIEKR